MADLNRATNGPLPSSPESYDTSLLPDYDVEFLSEADLLAFATALSAPDISPSTEDLLASPTASSSQIWGSKSSLVGRSSLDGGARRDSSSLLGNGGKSPLLGRSSADIPRRDSASLLGGVKENGEVRRGSMFITAQNDWAPIGHPSGTKVSGKRGKSKKGKRRKKSRSSDETREGYLYTLLKWPLLATVMAWVTGLGISYLFTRLYIWLYEHFVAWRGTRNKLRSKLQDTENYEDWVVAAKELDSFLGNDKWKTIDEFAYYDSKTVKRVIEQMRRNRRRVVEGKEGALGELTALVEACVKNNFVGVENSRLYSQTYYGTKVLVQNFIDEVEKAVTLLVNSKDIPAEEKRTLFKRMHTNYGRTALCLSGGASFAYYHFGVIKALLDADLLPEVITGTSGGALVAGLIATRTNEELKKLLVPALAGRINACSEPISTWGPRWWKTGARFDSLEWARRCSWFTRGSMTFREAYERTGRILNVSCVPADPHSPTILTNYLTSPDCVIWSAVLASAAVPGILNPVVLMMKTREATLIPYSFGHKWKDGSLRTDIPLKALNLHFNVNFSIVSQVNPHINLFFFSSRGSVGQPVTHRRGRGWRGGFLGSATEQYLKLDLNKWLKVVRHLELLPRPLGQDWSEIWLQQFSGTITIWPRSQILDFWRILSDPNPKQLARMLHVGQQSCFPKLKFLANRMKVERVIERGRRETRGGGSRRFSVEDLLSEDDLQGLLRGSSGGEDTEEALTTGDEGEFEEDVIDDPDIDAVQEKEELLEEVLDGNSKEKE